MSIVRLSVFVLDAAILLCQILALCSALLPRKVKGPLTPSDNLAQIARVSSKTSENRNKSCSLMDITKG